MLYLAQCMSRISVLTCSISGQYFNSDNLAERKALAYCTLSLHSSALCNLEVAGLQNPRAWELGNCLESLAA